MRTPKFHALLSLLGLALGCSSSHSGGASTQMDVQAAYCAYVARCRPDEFAFAYGSQALCEQMGPCTDPGRPPPGLENCVDKLATAPCREPVTSFGAAPPFCAWLSSESAKAGESCMDRGCEKGLHCGFSTATECYTCSPGADKPPATPKHVACTKPADCATDFACVEGACRGPGDLGSPCKEHSEGGSCASHLRCIDGICSRHACEPVPEGESPSWRYGTCADGLYLSSDDATCHRRSAENGACKAPDSAAGLAALSGNNANQCPDHQYCAPTGQCHDLLHEGEACSSGFACKKGLECDVHAMPAVCKAPRDDGADCEYSTQCKTGWCIQGTCGVAACSM